MTGIRKEEITGRGQELLEGRIIRGIAGFYYVQTDGLLYECKAKGLFRLDGIKPLVGDNCRIMPVEESDPDPEALPVGNIVEILPRENSLLRPAVANVDQALIVFAIRDPEPNFGVLDTFLLRMDLTQVPVSLGFNKADLDAEGQLQQKITQIYAPTGYPMAFFSAKKRTGLEQIKALLKGKTTALAGPSGAGKSSLINLMQMDVRMETMSVSAKTQRGRHTTRHSELIPLEEGGYICDTPGFTSLGSEGIDKEQIQQGFREIGKWRDGCRFAQCSHITEPDCSVREKLQEGLISPERYESYVRMYRECESRKKF